MATKQTPRAIGDLRVSERAGREDDRLHSRSTQRERITLLCDAQEWELVDVRDEGFVSGGRSPR
jgi:hypothetical protein